MSSLSNFLKLFKWNTEEDGEEAFNIEKALNENWEKIDAKIKENSDNIDNLLQLKEDGELKGQSAYEVAVKNGYIGTEEEWLNSLIGKQGPTGISIVKVEKTKTEGLVDTYTITYSDETTSTFQITNGKTPVKGTDYYTDTDKQEIVDDVVTATTPNFEQKHTIYRKEVTEEIEAESEMTLDFSYKSGNLEVFYCGERLLKDEDYEEVFEEGSETSNKIKVLFDIPLSEEFPRYFDFVVKGVIEDA